MVLTTIVIAFIIILLAFAALAIGWLLTGKSKIQAGSCGKDPTKKKNDKSCGTKSSCSLCEKDNDK